MFCVSQIRKSSFLFVSSYLYLWVSRRSWFRGLPNRRAARLRYDIVTVCCHQSESKWLYLFLYPSYCCSPSRLVDRIRLLSTMWLYDFKRFCLDQDASSGISLNTILFIISVSRKCSAIVVTLLVMSSTMETIIVSSAKQITDSIQSLIYFRISCGRKRILETHHVVIRAVDTAAIVAFWKKKRDQSILQ